MAWVLILRSVHLRSYILFDNFISLCYNSLVEFKGAKCVWRVEEVMFMKAVFKAVMILSSENVKNE